MGKAEKEQMDERMGLVRRKREEEEEKRKAETVKREELESNTRKEMEDAALRLMDKVETRDIELGKNLATAFDQKKKPPAPKKPSSKPGKAPKEKADGEAG